MKLIRRLPAFVVNGIAVAVGIGCIQLLIGAVAGAHAAQLALSGAVCASLADVPNTASRTWQRVAAAAVLGLAAATIVALLRSYPVALGFGVASIAFAAMMAMSWGARAGAVSFVPILAIVFTMAVPAGSEPWWELAGWNAVGGAMYLAWALAASALLKGFYRTYALCDALRATTVLLRARADLLDSPPAGKKDDADEEAATRNWIKGEITLAEALQTARDFVFARHDGDSAQRQIAVLLRAIDLRDILLASRLDLELLGSDAASRWIRERLAEALRRMGDALDAAITALVDGTEPVPLTIEQLDFRDLFVDVPLAADDARRRLLPAVVDRLRNLSGDIIRIHALLHGGNEELPLTAEQLRRFVAPEGWPLKALKAQMSWQSPVLRHALRSSLALGTAYFVALALPWSSHPQWLVLSVAVVLRGNLEQTLSRRNARVLGTLLGCAVVLGLSGVQSLTILGLCFLTAVGIAHSFVLQRYWLTAAAATVMALLQAHMVNSTGGFAVGERAADTLLGALLAWGFSYVLPSWERRSLPKAIGRVLKELRDYAGHALSLSESDEVEQRLARRRAYDALTAFAITLQRTVVEPKSVRLPLKEAAALLDHGQRLMAHLSMVRLMFARRGAELNRPDAAAALADAHQALTMSLDLHAAAAAGDAATAAEADEAPEVLPAGAPTENIMPWLIRRLNLLTRDARTIRQAAKMTLSKMKE